MLKIHQLNDFDNISLALRNEKPFQSGNARSPIIKLPPSSFLCFVLKLGVSSFSSIFFLYEIISLFSGRKKIHSESNDLKKSRLCFLIRIGILSYIRSRRSLSEAPFCKDREAVAPVKG